MIEVPVLPELFLNSVILAIFSEMYICIYTKQNKYKKLFL